MFMARMLRYKVTKCWKQEGQFQAITMHIIEYYCFVKSSVNGIAWSAEDVILTAGLAACAAVAAAAAAAVAAAASAAAFCSPASCFAASSLPFLLAASVNTTLNWLL